MDNTFMNELKEETNYGVTENGAICHRSTLNAVYDMFAFGGSYRNRSDEDCILLFKNALQENETLALKCLFYLRDARGGQGERRFFRVCYTWLAKKHPDIARRNFELIAEYGRWDDILYSLIDTPLASDALLFIKTQLALDIQCKTPSLLAKWLPSENASSQKTKRMAQIVRNYLDMTHREYRKTLSVLREKINIVERLMSANRWDEIEFDKIPSRAGLIYKNAFARRDIIAKKYEAFAKDETTNVNAKVLYPYEIVAKAIDIYKSGRGIALSSETDRAMLEKYWNNLPDYLEGKPCKMMCVVDTSGSMTCGGGASTPINVAISLGMYCAERVGGPFKDYYISFSSRPQLIKVQGTDFADKVNRIYRTNLCENTNLAAVFDLIKNIALKPSVSKDDIPETLVIFSDMEIDAMSYWGSDEIVMTEMEKIRKDWEAVGLKMPKLVYWNLDARNNTILDKGPNVSYVSGFSPVLMESILSGKTGIDIMLDKLNSERYIDIK